jgi:hypothetical protein
VVSEGESDVSKEDTNEPKYSVVSPVGRWAAEPIRIEAAARARHVGFVWDHVFRGDEMFAIVEEELRGHDPGLTFVRYQAFGDIHGRDARQAVASLPSRLRAEKVDAVIVGVGA